MEKPTSPGLRPARTSKFHPLTRKPHVNEWTATEGEAIARLYPAAAWPELLTALPGRTRDAIRKQANAAGIAREQKDRDWTPAERQAVRDHYPLEGPKGVAARLPGRTAPQVKKQAYKQGVGYVGRPAKPAPKPVTPKLAAPVKHRPQPGHGLNPVQVGHGSARGLGPATPNATARVKARRKADAEKPVPVALLVKGLPANSPGRALYATTAREKGGPAAEQALRAWLTNPPAA